MKKLYFGFVLIISGILLISASLISGAILAARNSYGDIFDSQVISTFTLLGFIMFVIGIAIAITEAFRKNRTES